jgi:hypothetical protein
MKTKPRVTPKPKPETQPSRKPMWEPERTCPAQVEKVFAP